MGNCFGEYRKPHRRPTLSSSQRRPVTVDREAETDIQDESTIVSQDRTTAPRPHRITFYYPADTALDIREKLPKERLHKRVDESVLIGRGQKVDIMLNEEHIPRYFAMVWYKRDRDMEPRWYLKNVSEKKLVNVHLDGVRTCLKFNEETELRDGCEVNFEVLTLVMKTQVGDPGNKQSFEVEVRPMENDSSNSSSGERESSQNRKPSSQSTTTYSSVVSTQERGRQGSTSAKGWEKRNVPCPEPAPLAEAVPVVQHYFHYCPNMFPPGSPGSTCCVHHSPYGCGPQQHQHCCTCHHPGQVCPGRKQSDQETLLQGVHSPHVSAKTMGMRYFPQVSGPATTVNPLMAQSSLVEGQNDPTLCSLPNMPPELFSGQHPENMARQPMYQPSVLTNRSGYALPELCGMHPNTLLPHGPSAFHLQQWLRQPPYAAYAEFQPAQPAFMNMLRRSQSLFTRPKKCREQRQRRSSCDGTQLTPLLVTQPESAQIGLSTQHRFSEPDVSSLILHETAHKDYHMASRDALLQCTQIDSLKYGASALAAVSPKGPDVPFNMSHSNADSWDVADTPRMPAPSACANSAMNGRYPTEGISNILPPTGFSSSSSASGDDRSCTSTARLIHGSLRQPQENDERQAAEKLKHI